jgi:4-amino-4-deoxy-L-arabinose transferase-like glycosyltransferase
MFSKGYMAEKKTDNSFPAVNWHRRDWILLATLAVLGCILFWSGLSIKSLWGPEGRWAMVVREMLQSGNYFVPTVNGAVDLDKPLLSYWAILPFAKAFGLNELTLRIPGTMAAIGVVLFIFVIGRRLFGYRTGLVASLLLLASPMFVLWGKTASADLLNTLAIWAVFWVFLAGAFDGHLLFLMLFYSTGAIASFLKGPVAPAVSLASLGLYSCVGVMLEYKDQGFPKNALENTVSDKFRWIATRHAVAGLVIGGTIFILMLLAPSIITGSWSSLSLMWKENVVRFFSPFDHMDPWYVYLFQILFFSAPWSFLLVVSLINAKRWKPGRESRWILLTALGIFLFFTISASRRSYYILPLIPALALITGKSLVDWIDGGYNINRQMMRIAATITSILVALAGIALVYTYATMETYRDVSLLVMAPIATAGGAGSMFFFLKRKYLRGLTALLAVVILFQFWGFTLGTELMEHNRTLRTFAKEIHQTLDGVQDDKIFIYQHGTASLLFYLNRPHPVKNVNTVKEIEQSVAQHPDGYLIVDLREATTPQIIRCLNQMVVVRKQEGHRQKREQFALLRFH